MNIITCLASIDAVKPLLVSFLMLVLVLVLIGGLFLVIERVFGLLPNVKPIIGTVLLILVLLWAVNQFL